MHPKCRLKLPKLLEAYKFLARQESIFCEPASAASVAGLIATDVIKDSVIVCVLTGHGLKDPDIAISQISVPVRVEPNLRDVLKAMKVNVD